jgi:DNA helicase-2/ATP-dependent DNA helicase PcrA
VLLIEDILSARARARAKDSRTEVVRLPISPSVLGLISNGEMGSLTTSPVPTRRSIESGDVEEERRLFYVAVTRAKNELYISYPKIATRAGPGGMMLAPSRFLQELPTDLYDELRIKRSYCW